MVAVGLSFTSCDMDVKVPGAINQDDAITNIERLGEFRNQSYNILRSVTAGSWVTDPDLQADYYIGLKGNGGRTSRQIQGGYVASSSEPSDKYTSIYSSMKHINFAIVEGQKLIDNGAVSEDDVIVAKRYIGEMKFTRAYLYYYLFDHYCQPYSADIADLDGYGCQLVTVYDPTIPVAQYPGRSSMNKTVELINSDLSYAYDALIAWETVDATNLAANAAYLNSATVRALQARMALLTKNYNKAYEYAEDVVVNNAEAFGLASGEEYISMWSTDASNELLFVPYADKAEASSAASFFYTYNYTPEFATRVNCVPTMEWLLQYEDGDVRFDAFFTGKVMTIDAQKTAAYILNKYPGNESLNVDPEVNDYLNKAKPFRLSELYLILAEAGYELGKADAVNYLHELRANRIEGYTPEALTGAALRDAIRLERAKEFIGEGFRLSDLRRWGLGFSRDSEYGVISTGTVDVATLFVDIDANTVYTPGDYRYTWPIPYSEIQICSALAGQQNPGY